MQTEWAQGLIRLDQDGDIWRVTLNRPDKANALTQDMLAALVVVAKQAQAARVLVLSGTGNVFSAGADLEAARAGLALSPLWEDLSGTIAALPGLTVAALNGTMAGGAMGMGLACDLRIAVPEARFFYPVMSLGFLPQPSDPVRLRALIGPARTKLLLMGGAKIDAQDALRFGLVDHVVPRDELAPTVDALIAPATQADPDIFSRIKAMCDASAP